ncbi:MAG: hypothetical protein ABFS38_09910 [Bacteroidota bacterium]
MDEVGPIPKASPDLKSQDFFFLREEGMNILRSVAADTWSDHNIHDPGITLLEGLCYAITETGLRCGMDIKDLIASDTSGYKQPMYTAAEILPSGALTLTDFRKILMDHQIIRNAWLFPISSEPVGKYNVLLEFENEEFNSNTFSVTVNPPALSNDCTLDIAFPYWDEEDVFPFYEEVSLLNVSFEGTPGNEWNPISGSEAHFARIVVDYQPTAGGPESTSLWLVAQVTTPMDNPLGDLPLILADLNTKIATLGAASLLESYRERVMAVYNSIRIVRRYLKDYRNLCEAFVNFNAVRLQEISVSATIDVNPGVILENLLADIFLKIDRFIAPENYFESLENMSKSISTDKIFEGPLLESGFLSESSLGDPELTDVLYTSDILRLIIQLRDQNEQDILKKEDISERNIVSVSNLSLTNYLDNRRITSDARDCLNLVKSQRHLPRLSLSKSRIVFYRNAIEVPCDINQVIGIFIEKKSELQSQLITHSSDIPLPEGDQYEIDKYYPVQNDLPLTYGVGEAGLPENVSDERKALALQLKGYLLLYEQLIAGMGSQLTNLNAFFSADPAVNRTIFHHPLYHLPLIEKILKDFYPDLQTWESFIADPNNGYKSTIEKNSESRGQFLSRRNRVLDHILAIFGEDLQDKVALLFRKASEVQGASGITLEELLQKQSDQRDQASSQLIRDKSAFIEDLPALNRDRAQSFGNPVWRNYQLFRMDTLTGGSWLITDGGSNPIFHSSTDSGSFMSCLKKAAEALSLATIDSNYTVVLLPGGQHRLEVSSGPSSRAVAESVATYASNTLALAAIPGWVQTAIQLWWRFGLSPIECRLLHMLGIREKERRQLVRPLNTYFEIYDDTPNPNFEKRFRLWELPGLSGDELLNSELNYPGTSNADALQNAEEAIRSLISRGFFKENYEIENPAPGIFQVVLTLSGGTIVARSTNLSTHKLAEEEIERIRDHLYFWYSAEGFYMIEHFLLYPDSETDPELEIGDMDDPHSFQMTFVFPSGYARDFVGSQVEQIQPDPFRDPEFRKHTEKQVRKACPSHILPRILWVDRVLPGSIVTPLDPSFENFEQRYRAWFEMWIVDEADQAAVGPLKNDMVEILGIIYQDVLP